MMAKRQRRTRVDDALRTNEERYGLATRATRDVIWDWDMVTDEVVWGEAMSEVFGYSTDQVPFIIAGARPWWLAHLHPEGVERTHASYQAFLQSGMEERPCRRWQLSPPRSRTSGGVSVTW